MYSQNALSGIGKMINSGSLAGEWSDMDLCIQSLRQTHVRGRSIHKKRLQADLPNHLQFMVNTTKVCKLSFF